MRAVLKVIPWARPYWRFALASVLGTLISVLINLMIPLLTSQVIDDGIAADDGGVVGRLALTMVGLILLGMVISAFSVAMGVRLAFHTITDLRRDLYERAQSLSFGNLDRIPSSEILTRLTSDMTKVLTVLTMGLSFMAQIPILFVGSLVAIISIDASLSVIVAFMVPVIGVAVWYVLTRSGRLYDAVQTRLDRLNGVLQENIQGAEVVKAFVRQDQQQERFDDVTDDLATQAIAVNQLVASMMPTLILISSMGIAAVLWLGGNNVIQGSLSEGNLVAFISYMSLVVMPMIMFAFMQPMISAAGASMQRIDQVLNAEPEVPDAGGQTAGVGGGGIDLGDQPEPGDVRFDGVCFRYGAADPETTLGASLTDVDLHIPQGRTVAILGATGSGKSTLVHLIPRFYDVTDGSVLVGGVDVRQLSKSSLRRRIGIALQEPYLFSGTVMENLRYGRPDATDDEVIEAAKAAQAHGFISEMADGYDSMIEQGGSNLSGGQRQRMSIARTLVVDPSVLILDDSTSAVDLDTEARIQEALAASRARGARGVEGDRTVILVAQRISTALGADEIIVLDKGRVAATGTHEKLLETSPIYQEIFHSQLGSPVR